MSKRFKFTENTIKIMGKDYKYKEVTNRELEDKQEEIENFYKQFNDLIKEAEDLEDELNNINNLIEMNQIKIDSVLSENDPEDEDLKEVRKIADKVMEYEEKRMDIAKEIREFNKKTEKEFKQIMKSIDVKLGEVCSTMLENFSVNEFVENMDDIDKTIAQNIGTIRKMSKSGSKPKAIEKFIQGIIKNESDSLLASRSPFQARRQRNRQ